RLAGAARTPVPCAEAVAGAALVWRRGAARPRPVGRGARAALRRVGTSGRALRDRRPAPVLAGVLPATRTGRSERGAVAKDQRDRADLPDPHQGRRAVRAAPGDRGAAAGGTPRGGRREADPGGRGRGPRRVGAT